jgi:hypothetical protein
MSTTTSRSTARNPHTGAELQDEPLVLCLGSSHPKPHRSRCDLAAAFEVDEALGAVRAVAVGDVAGESVVEGVPVEVVGVLDDELTDRQEVALDAV